MKTSETLAARKLIIPNVMKATSHAAGFSINFRQTPSPSSSSHLQVHISSANSYQQTTTTPVHTTTAKFLKRLENNKKSYLLPSRVLGHISMTVFDRLIVQVVSGVNENIGMLRTRFRSHGISVWEKS